MCLTKHALVKSHVLTKHSSSPCREFCVTRLLLTACFGNLFAADVNVIYTVVTYAVVTSFDFSL